MKFCHLLIALLPALVFGACANYDTRLTNRGTSYLGTDGSITNKEMSASIAESKSYWDGEGTQGSPSIVIDVRGQTASFYKGDKLVGVSAVSSGRDGHDTPPGNYKIIEKKVNHRSNLYGDYVDASGNPVVKGVAVRTDPMPPGTSFLGAPMPFWMRLTTSGVGLHQGFLPGVPDSRGCIRLPESMAKVYFENAPLGTPVRIIN